MRPLWKDVLAAVWLGILLPGIVLQLCVLKQGQPPPLQRAAARERRDPVISLRSEEGIPEPMPLNDYLTGVLLAEIPASFGEEALKAQAVAARTYVWKAHTGGGKHEDGSVCRESACCQAFIGEEDYLTRGGTEENLEKVRSCVTATADTVLSWEGELIEATYFSASGGATESARAVWGGDYPYLQSVESPGEQALTQETAFSPAQLQALLGRSLPGKAEDWFGDVRHTEGGGVETMEIGGERYSGTHLRSVLGLRSTAFAVQVRDGCVVFTTRGYGHRVGLSQYGAEAMAQGGKTWQQILQHYYPGTNLHPIG